MDGILLIGTSKTDVDVRASGEMRLAPEELRHRLLDVANGLGDLFDGYAGAMLLDSVSVQLGVTASGEVGIIVAKSTVQVGTTITLTFKPRH